jgi:hypothetical protein
MMQEINSIYNSAQLWDMAKTYRDGIHKVTLEQRNQASVNATLIIVRETKQVPRLIGFTGGQSNYQEGTFDYTIVGTINDGIFRLHNYSVTVPEDTHMKRFLAYLAQCHKEIRAIKFTAKYDFDKHLTLFLNTTLDFSLYSLSLSSLSSKYAAADVARYLTQASRLQFLNLDGHNFPQQERKTILSNLSKNTGLKNLRFSATLSTMNFDLNSATTIEDLKIIKDVCRTKKNLTHISLQLSFEPGIFQALSNMLESNTALQALTIVNVQYYGNSQKQELAEELKKALANNRDLLEINFPGLAESTSKQFQSIQTILAQRRNDKAYSGPEYVPGLISQHQASQATINNNTSTEVAPELNPEDFPYFLNLVAKGKPEGITRTCGEGILISATTYDVETPEKEHNLAGFLTNSKLRIERPYASETQPQEVLINNFFSYLKPYFAKIEFINLIFSSSTHPKELALTLQNLSQLKSLRYAYFENSLSSEDHAQLLGNLINGNSNLRYLSLKNHHFKLAARQTFLASLAKNQTLTHLVLTGVYFPEVEYNKSITAEDFKTLQAVYETNQTLTHLTLQVSFKDEIYPAFTEMLRNNTTIKSLTITNFDFPMFQLKLLQALKEALQENTSLTEVTLPKASWSASEERSHKPLKDDLETLWKEVQQLLHANANGLRSSTKRKRAPQPDTQTNSMTSKSPSSSSSLGSSSSNSLTSALNQLNVTSAPSPGSSTNSLVSALADLNVASTSPLNSGSGSSLAKAIISNTDTPTTELSSEVINPDDLIVETTVAKGAQGTVFKGSWKNIAVAIKAGTQDKYSTREIEILSKISHPNLVKMYGSTNSPFAIVMEWMNKGNLHQYERSEEYLSLDWQHILGLMHDITLGLDYLHSNQKIVHRDLKPENLLLSSVDGKMVIKIGDFGFARQFNPNQSMTMGPIGTLRYMDPRVFFNYGYTISSDLFSLGVVFYEMVNFAGEGQQRKFIGLPEQFSQHIFMNGLRENVFSGQYSISTEFTAIAPEVANVIRSCGDHIQDNRKDTSEIIKTLVVVRTRMMNDNNTMDFSFNIVGTEGSIRPSGSDNDDFSFDIVDAQNQSIYGGPTN